MRKHHDDQAKGQWTTVSLDGKLCKKSCAASPDSISNPAQLLEQSEGPRNVTKVEPCRALATVQRLDYRVSAAEHEAKMHYAALHYWQSCSTKTTSGAPASTSLKSLPWVVSAHR